ncbi:MAG: carbohydrate kinase family protein [Bacillota bacterium]
MILGCGALNVDYIFDADELVTDGESCCRPVGRQPGGSAANTVCALAKLGLPAGFAGAVGDDDDAALVMESLISSGVDTRAVVVKNGLHTGRILGFVDKKGQRALYVSPGANTAVCLDELRLGLVPPVGWVHCSSFAGEEPFAVQRSFVLALPESVRFSFAPGALYARRGIRDLRPFLNRCEVLFLARPEMKKLTGRNDPLQGSRKLLDEGVCTVVVTLGGEGSMIAAGSTLHDLPAVGMAVVDTTGAGDAFAAGFVYGCAKGWSLEESHRFAAVAASFVVEDWGARKGLPTLRNAGERYEQVFALPFPKLV